MGITVGINMGKTRARKWGLIVSSLLIMGITAVHIFVKTSVQPSPEALPNAQPAPLAGLVVCLDPGHGGYDGGARGAQSHEPEAALNLDVAQRLKALLQLEGAKVILTRDTDVALADPGANRKRRDLQARVDAAANADLFLSIHMNEYRTAAESGPQVFYRANATASRLLAGFLQDALNAQLSPARLREAHAAEFYVLERLSIPAVLVECGFLSHPGEEALLLTPAYRQRVAEALLAGIQEYTRCVDDAEPAR